MDEIDEALIEERAKDNSTALEEDLEHASVAAFSDESSEVDVAGTGGIGTVGEFEDFGAGSLDGGAPLGGGLGSGGDDSGASEIGSALKNTSGRYDTSSGVDDDAGGLVDGRVRNFFDVAMNDRSAGGELGVVDEDGVGANDDSIEGGTLAMSPGESVWTGDPTGVSGSGGNFAIEGSGIFDDDEGESGRLVFEVASEDFTRLARAIADGDFDT